MTETPDILEDAPETTLPDETPTDTTDMKVYATDELAKEAGVFNSLWNVAGQIAETEFVPKGLRGSPPKVFAAMLTGKGLGIDPMSSMREISIIDGKPNLSAALQLALVRRAGHEVTGEAGADKAVIEGRRKDGESMTVTYTLDDAVKAGLVKLDSDGQPVATSKQGHPLPWQKYTANMLWARAVTTLVGRLFPDVVVGETL